MMIRILPRPAYSQGCSQNQAASSQQQQQQQQSHFTYSLTLLLPQSECQAGQLCRRNRWSSGIIATERGSAQTRNGHFTARTNKESLLLFSPSLSLSLSHCCHQTVHTQVSSPREERASAQRQPTTIPSPHLLTPGSVEEFLPLHHSTDKGQKTPGGKWNKVFDQASVSIGS